MSSTMSRTIAQRFGSQNSTFAPGVAEREVELLGLPPRVERHARGAHARARPEHHDPLDGVRGEHRDAVAGADAELVERDRDLAGLGVVLAEGEPPVALHQPVGVGTGVADGDDVAHRPEPVLVDLQRDAEDVLGRRSRTGRRGRAARSIVGAAVMRRARPRAGRRRTATAPRGWTPGPSPVCCRCPCWNAALDIQAWKSSSLRQRVYTRNVSRSSLGRSSSKASKPGQLLTSPARAANRATSSSARSAGTVIALILTTLMISPRGPAGRAGRATLGERGPGAADTTPR